MLLPPAIGRRRRKRPAREPVLRSPRRAPSRSFPPSEYLPKNSSPIPWAILRGHRSCPLPQRQSLRACFQKRKRQAVRKEETNLKKSLCHCRSPHCARLARILEKKSQEPSSLT